jgi:glycine cleavage system regulatory protein
MSATPINNNGNGNRNLIASYQPSGLDETLFRFLKASGSGRDRPGIVYRIAKTIRKHGGNIILQRSMKVAGDFAITVIASFDRENASGLRNALQAFAQGVLGEDFSLSACEIELNSFAPLNQGGRKYVVTVSGDDRMGIIESMTLLLFQNSINLDSMESEVSYRPFQGTPTFSSMFEITIPGGFDMEAFSSELEQFERNTDLTILVRQQ